MAYPSIVFDNNNGSDTQASGAGPSAALFGTTDASFSGATVTLTAGTDLTNVATDGSAVLYLSTSSGVKFFKITAKAGSGGATPTVDVTPNPAGTSTGRTWAIGGKRKTLNHTDSRLLFDNGGSAGDAKGGWKIQIVSGDTQSITSAINLRGGTDNVNGNITIETVPGYSTKATLSYNQNSALFVMRSSGWKIANVIGVNSNSTKTASIFAGAGSGDAMVFEGVELTGSGSSTQWWRGVDPSNGNGAAGFRLYNCRIENCASHGIACANSATAKIAAEGCSIKNNGGWGVFTTPALYSQMDFIGCLITGNASGGILDACSRADLAGDTTISGCTIHGNGGSAIEFSTPTNGMMWAFQLRIVNNIFTGNGTLTTGYGLYFSGSSMTKEILESSNIRIMNNVYGVGSLANTSGDSNLDLSSFETGKVQVDPDYVNAAGGDFTPQDTAVRAAFPTSIP